MKVTGGDLDVSVDWLNKTLGNESEESLFQPDFEPSPATEVVYTPPVKPWQKAADPDPKMGASTLMPAKGALGMLINYINETAIRPQPILALGASLCAIGTLAGRKYRSPSNLRTNMYVVSLADSGAGKDHARTVIDHIFGDLIGLGDRLGGDKIASGAGLISAVTRNPAILFQLDEFGAFLQGIANRNKAPAHLTEILHNMTQLFTTANKTYRGVEYANQKERPRIEIIQPCMSIYGTTVPSNFWKAMESNSAIDGSLARFLALESDVNYPDDQNPIEKEPPEELLTLMARIAESITGTPIGSSGQFVPELMMVTYDDAAQTIIRDLQKKTLDKLREVEGSAFTAFWARRMELIVKVAMIHAIGCDPENPIINSYDVNFAKAVTDRSIKLMIEGVERFVSDNQAESLAKRVVDIVRKSKGGEINKAALYAKTLFLGRDRENTLKALEESGILIKEILQTAGRPKMLYKLPQKNVG